MSRYPFRFRAAPFKHPTNPRAHVKGTLQSLKGAGRISATELRHCRVVLLHESEKRGGIFLDMGKTRSGKAGCLEAAILFEV